MFKPHYGICLSCDRERLLVVKAQLCCICNKKKKGTKVSKPISKMSRTQYHKKKSIQEIKKNWYPKDPTVSSVGYTPDYVD